MRLKILNIMSILLVFFSWKFLLLNLIHETFLVIIILIIIINKHTSKIVGFLQTILSQIELTLFGRYLGQKLPFLLTLQNKETF